MNLFRFLQEAEDDEEKDNEFDINEVKDEDDDKTDDMDNEQDNNDDSDLDDESNKDDYESNDDSDSDNSDEDSYDDSDSDNSDEDSSDDNEEEEEETESVVSDNRIIYRQTDLFKEMIEYKNGVEIAINKLSNIEKSDNTIIKLINNIINKFKSLKCDLVFYLKNNFIKNTYTDNIIFFKTIQSAVSDLNMQINLIFNTNIEE